MAFVAIPNTARVDLRTTLFGQLLQNTLYFLSGEPITAQALDTLLTGLSTWVLSEFIGQVASNVIVRELFAQDMSEQNGITATSAFNNVTGVAEGTSLPGNVCIVPSLRTGRAGRSYRGRLYVSGLPDSFRSGNQWVEARLADVRGVFQTLVGSEYVPVGWDWVVVSRVEGGVVRPVPVCTPVVTVSMTDSDIDSQRRRLSGRGQ